jgi:hypothetical protein
VPFTFDPQSARYRDSVSGKFVPAAEVRGAVDVVIEQTSQRLQQITGGLQNGTLTIDDWRGLMAAEIKSLHLATASAAMGGWNQMAPADWGWVGQRLRTQYQYLDGFAQDVASGKQMMDGTLAVRASLYALAATGTNREMERRQARLRGEQQERNQLGAADHCPGCLDQTARGWQPIGSLMPVGSRSCLARCHCSMTYRTAPAAA